MAIHHDKAAYGKLAKQSEDLSEERLAEMLKALSENKAKDGDESSPADPNGKAAKNEK